MDSNPVVSTGSPPQHGARSYAEMIKQYLIYGRFYAGWHKSQGRYTFSVIHAEGHEHQHHWARPPIGYEMVNRGMVSRDNWVLRVYMDGTALFRSYQLGSLRYPTARTITGMIEHFYYKEGELQSGYQRTAVLRRRPLNPNAITQSTGNFGEFLEGKYNH